MKHITFASLLSEYAENPETPDTPDFVLPEDLAALNDEALRELHDQAVGLFETLYGSGSDLSEEDLAALATLAEAVETLGQEIGTREQAQAERDAAAAELASRIRPTEAALDADTETAEDSTDEGGTDEAEAEDEPVAVEAEEPQAVAAAAAARTGQLRVSIPASRRSRPSLPPSGEPTTMRDVVMAGGDVPGFAAGQGMDWNDLGRAVDRRLASFNATQYANAAAAGRLMREQHSVAVLRKPIPADLMLSSSDPSHVDEVIQRAVSESRLPGGSLVASGGWCAPSETLYSLVELESRDGLYSVPEIGIARGGISFTPGPTFADIYTSVGFGPYTEAEDEDGDYDGEGGGSKPTYVVTCPSFTEKRLESIGLSITAGLLQARGYPEVIARTVRGALVAHDHRVSTECIADVVAGSTAVTMNADQVGATAPVLDAIELQAEHYRYIHRMSRATTLEAVFPFWVRGVVRSDLARRQGMSEFAVTDAQIDAWFSLRGIRAQYVYDWQPLTGTADTFVEWPSSVKFLLYSAGTWVRGTSDIITLDTVYDSVNLGTNDYTALFTEEGYLMAKVGHDSRVVTVDVCPSGLTGAGVSIECDGTLTGTAS